MLDSLTRLLFEDVTLLLFAEIVALAVVLAIHRRRFTPRSRRLVWVTLGVCGVLLAIQHLTVTKREAVEAMITELADAVDEGDVRAIADRLDEDFQYHRWADKDDFVEEVRRRLQNWQIDQASVGGFEISVEGDLATASFRGLCDWRGSNGGGYQPNVLSFWTVECVRRETGWKLARIEQVKVGPGRQFDLSDLWGR